MRKVNFEYLTKEENKDIQTVYNKYARLLRFKAVTQSEANFLFAEYCIKHYKEKAFGIVTNLEMF